MPAGPSEKAHSDSGRLGESYTCTTTKDHVTRCWRTQIHEVYLTDPVVAAPFLQLQAGGGGVCHNVATCKVNNNDNEKLSMRQSLQAKGGSAHRWAWCCPSRSSCRPGWPPPAPPQGRGCVVNKRDKWCQDSHRMHASSMSTSTTNLVGDDHRDAEFLRQARQLAQKLAQVHLPAKRSVALRIISTHIIHCRMLLAHFMQTTKTASTTAYLSESSPLPE